MDLQQRYVEMRKSRGPAYRPRTKHLDEKGQAKYTNRLFLESSPYLLQHAHNPVDWHPWGEEAFRLARELDRPVILSVGYSTCHWCHVMEEESFEDEEIARYMNDHYVCIKVDREERPDIDAVYMSAVQVLTGAGGWPMTVWLTADGKPFYGGTYFPARDGDRGSRLGFLTFLARLEEIFRQEQEAVTETADRLVASIREMLEARGQEAAKKFPEVNHERLWGELTEYYQERFDRHWGGLTGAPKFPSSLPLRLLLRLHRRNGNKELLTMVKLTLEKMRAGGIYDQVGGGFHRYSTDGEWLVPHFEKMLYDNALLVRAYLETYQVTQEKKFAQTAREVLHYVEREMTSPEGAFFSATDADNLTPAGHREEGDFFVWSMDDWRQALREGNSWPDREEEVLHQLGLYWGLSKNGNFEGKNILHTPFSLHEAASVLGMAEGELESLVGKARAQLYEVRRRRSPPIRDEKILVAWNGLMISAFVQAALVLNDEHYLSVAQKAAQSIVAHMVVDRGAETFLLRSRVEGVNSKNQEGRLDDYANLIAALLDLYGATGTKEWMKLALGLDQTLHRHFEDKECGGFYTSALSGEQLISKERPGHDGATPAGNSIQLMNLFRLAAWTWNDDYRKRAEAILDCFAGNLQSHPMAHAEMLMAILFSVQNPRQVMIVTGKGKLPEAWPFVTLVERELRPPHVVTLIEEGEELWGSLPKASCLEGKVTAYICEKGACQRPVNDLLEFSHMLSSVGPT